MTLIFVCLKIETSLFKVASFSTFRVTVDFLFPKISVAFKKLSDAVSAHKCCKQSEFDSHIFNQQLMDIIEESLNLKISKRLLSTWESLIERKFKFISLWAWHLLHFIWKILKYLKEKKRNYYSFVPFFNQIYIFNRFIFSVSNRA